MLFQFVSLFNALLLAFPILLASLPLPAFGSDSQSARTAALGGAGHAGPFYTDAIYLNPSALALMRGLAISGQYVLPPEGVANAMTVAGIASLNEMPIQAGAGYARRSDGTFMHFSLARELIERVALGAGLKLFQPGRDPEKLTPELTVAATAIATDWFRASLTFDNAFGTLVDDGMPRELVFGTRTNVASLFTVFFDPHLARSAWGYEAGIEIPFLEYYFLRAGTFDGATVAALARPCDGYAGGFGVFFPWVSLDYAFSRATSPVSATLHTFSATLNF